MTVNEQIKSVAEKNLGENTSEYYQFGYKVFGPFLLGFTAWLAEKTKENSIEKILFFARDGYMMQKAYNEFPLDEHIKNDYFYCSRKSLRQALLWKLHNYKDSIKYVNISKFVSMGYMLEYYGFSNTEAVEICRQENVSIDYSVPYSEVKDNETYKNLYLKYQRTIEENSKRQDDLLFQYVKQFDLPERVAIVDIGWHSSMQYYFEEFLLQHGIDAVISGYYVGNYSFYDLKGTGFGYLFSDGKDPNRKKVMCSHGVMEKLFQSLEGSTAAYELDGGQVNPVNSEYEYGSDGKIVGCISSWQQASLAFINDFFADGNTLMNLKEYANPLIDFGLKPTIADTKVFSFFYNIDGQKYFFLPQKKIFQYKPGELLRALNYSPWKTGFMKSLFKIPFPYYVIYRTLS